MASGELKIRLTNTLTRRKEDFVPLDPANVRMYVCGPTVYDYAHIGNARPAIVFDVLFRLLRHVYGESHVTYVRNITDVDDKINARAVRDYPGLSLNEAIRKVTETTARQYEKDVTALGCLSEDNVNVPGEPPRFIQPRATENIFGMVQLIQMLLDKGHAYVARGADGREALFDVMSMPDYGKLSRRDDSAKVAGARVEQKDHKRNPEDFVLWKESDAAEPGWDARFSVSNANRAELNLNSNDLTIRGRPGWHIECSAMSERYLWTEVESRLSAAAHEHPHTFDIHAGGLDLIFPHHENEIAQSRCAHGTPTMARYWLHNGFLQVEGQKMSKSLGNFITIHELLETDKFGGWRWPGPVLRLAMLMTNYREPIDFTAARLEEADISLSYFSTFAFDNGSAPSSEFMDALADDLNTPRAIAELNRLLKVARGQGARLADRASRPDAILRDDDFAAAGQLAAALKLLGVNLDEYDRDWLKKQSQTSTVEGRVADRLAALNAKDFKRADEIRAALLADGIQLMDSKNDAGERVTKWEVKR